VAATGPPAARPRSREHAADARPQPDVHRWYRHGYHMVTGVRECDGRLYLGSLTDSSVATVAL
jgi:hypothetical protein